MALCAVIVSYNCDDNIVRLVNNISLSLVGKIYIIDNGSVKESLDILHQLSERPNVKIVELEENKGIASALNLGLKNAQMDSFEWMITFDQDSYPQPDMINKLYAELECWNKKNKKYVAIGPNLCIDGDIENAKKKEKRGVRHVSYLITSGNIVLIDAALKVGGYTDKLFIDAVDYDFSCKLRAHGYKLLRTYQLFMLHELGERVDGRITHSEKREYYMIRNQKYLMKTWFWRFPGYILFESSLFLVARIGDMKNAVNRLNYVQKFWEAWRDNV